jgi:hypothetical protein
MSTDPIARALADFSDDEAFELMAVEYIRNQGYENVWPLGGVGDKGRDGQLKPEFVGISANLNILQATTEVDTKKKIKESIEKVLKLGTKVLHFVTNQDLSTVTIDKFVESALGQGIILHIYPLAALVIELGKAESNLLQRYLPEVYRQLEKSAAEARDADLLRLCLALEVGVDARRARRSIIESILILTANKDPEKKFSSEEIFGLFKANYPELGVDVSQTRAIVKRLITEGALSGDPGSFSISKLTAKSIVSSNAKVSELLENYVARIIRKVETSADSRLVKEKANLIDRNIRTFIDEFMKRFAIEFAGRGSGTISDSLTVLKRFLGDGLSNDLRNIIWLAVLDSIKKPSAEDNQFFRVFSLAYIGAGLVNLHPDLRKVYEKGFSGCEFILDTDVILTCLIKDLPDNKALTGTLKLLAENDAKICIPMTSLTEVEKHLQSDRSFEEHSASLLSMPEAAMKEAVSNLLVRGYYYYAVGKKNIDVIEGYKKYSANYMSRNTAVLVRDRLRSVIGDKIMFVNNGEFKYFDIKKREEIVRELVDHQKRGMHSVPRSDSNMQILAANDTALLEYVCYRRSERQTEIEKRKDDCWLVSGSGVFNRLLEQRLAMPRLTVRPIAIASLIELRGKKTLTDNDFLKMLDGSLVVSAVNHSMAHVEKAIKYGLDLKDYDLVKLEHELEHELKAHLEDLPDEPSVVDLPQITVFLQKARQRKLDIDRRFEKVLVAAETAHEGKAAKKKLARLEQKIAGLSEKKRRQLAIILGTDL